MKHPLTSKERRGLVAVAAAALLCICSGFIFRNCNSHLPANSNNGSQFSSVKSDSIIHNDSSSLKYGTKENTNLKSSKSHKSDKDSLDYKATKNSKSTKSRSRKKKIPKFYPTRDPLSEPCD